MDLKAVAWIAAGVAVGFALGGIPARRELAATRAERDALQTRLDQLARPNLLQAFLPGLAGPTADNDEAGEDAPGTPGAAPNARTDDKTAERGSGQAPPAPRGDVAVIGVPERAPSSAARAASGPDPGAPSPTASTVPANADDASDDAPARERRRRDPGELLARFDQLVAAQRARSAAARSALIEQGELDAEQLTRVDSAVTRMNGKLAGYGEEAIAQVASEEPPSPAQALGLGHDVSGILFEAQKELDAVVGDNTEDVDPSALEIWNYVDVEQWRPHVEKELAARQGSAQVPPASPTGGAAGSAAAPGEPAR
jgi:hypothetical protein